ncbi:basic proline-rich protein-like [Iris pallida]|uniref:Basic proline-rich protein-like n=1 Tax=Iris pallida TaxID=29817 RepID=A0AAX6H229_IRIPA|nr:basic proline-rich protein-like [Iris pallida]
MFPVPFGNSVLATSYFSGLSERSRELFCFPNIFGNGF